MGDLYSFHSSQKSSFLHQIHIHTQGLWSRCQCCYPKSHSDPRTSSYLKEASHTHTHTHKDVLGWKKQMILQTKTNIEMSPMHIHYALKCAYGD